MEYLVLGPAGMGMFSIVGSLMKYEDDLKHIKEISGASAGAIIGVALALRIPLHDVLDKLLSVDFENLSQFKLKSFVSSYGFINLKQIRATFVRIYGSDPVFSELPIKMYISAYCVNRGRTEYFSVDTHPDMKVIDAVCMSMAIPFIISTARYNGMLYTDGGTKELYPLAPFIDKKPEKIMCVKLKQKDIFHEKIEGIKQFLQAMISSVLKMPDTYTVKVGKVVELDIDDEYMFKFHMTHEEKLKLFILGINS